MSKHPRATFNKVVNDLEIKKGDRQKLLPLVFAYSALKYGPSPGVALSGKRKSFLEILIIAGHTTPKEIGDQNPKVFGDVHHGTITAAASFLEKHRGLPVQRQPMSPKPGRNQTQYSRYYLTPEFKKELIKEAVNDDAALGEDAKLSAETHDLIAALDQS